MRPLAAVAGALALTLAAAPALAQTLTVVGPTGQTQELAADDLAALPRESVVLRHGGHGSGAEATYEGATLTSILRRVRTPAGPRMHGDPTRLMVVVTGEDGYKAVFSLVETDPWFGKAPIIVADRKAGAPLDEAEGPLRLVVGGDTRPERAVKGVTRIEVKPGAR